MKMQMIRRGSAMILSTLLAFSGMVMGTSANAAASGSLQGCKNECARILGTCAATPTNGGQYTKDYVRLFSCSDALAKTNPVAYCLTKCS